MAEDDDWRWEGFPSMASCDSRHSFSVFSFPMFLHVSLPCRRVWVFHRLEEDVRDDELCNSGYASCVPLRDASCA